MEKKPKGKAERSDHANVISPAGCPQLCLPGSGWEVGSQEELCVGVAGVWDALHGDSCFQFNR